MQSEVTRKGTCVPGGSDVQQTPDREQIRSQPSSASGSSVLTRFCRFFRGLRERIRHRHRRSENHRSSNNLCHSHEGQSATGTDERTPLSFKPSDREFHFVYEKQFSLGRGNYGDVYMAIRKSDGRKVAVKSIKRLIDDIPVAVAGYPEPVMTDVAMMVKLKQPPTCPYVIEMFEWFDYPDKIEIAMEYPAPCVELRKLISLSYLNEENVRKLMCQAAQAVNHCLDRGVFHNDIHTSNILVNHKTFNLKLIDFGCALVYKKGELYPNYKYRGIYPFRPPEVNAMKDFEGEQTNVFQLGKLLELMSSGCRPRLSNDWRKLEVACKAHTPKERPSVKKLLKNKLLASPSPTTV